MERLGRRMVLAGALLLALGAAVAIPRALHGTRLWLAQDDPVALSDIALETVFSANVAEREIDAALQAGDIELARSFVALAAERGTPIGEALRARVAAAEAEAASALATARRFAAGFAHGEPHDVAEFAGTLAGDLFVYGDIRDVVRESARGMRGEAVDELVLGLACIGLAVTAGTYASLGATAPARAGVSFLKAAGRAGRIGAEMSETLLRPLRGVVDRAALASALGRDALVRPAAAARGIREAVKVERMREVLAFAGDVGRVQARAGTRGAFDAMRVAQSPKDMARLSRLAQAKGAKTRAVLKLVGRSAIVLTMGLVELASWILWAALLLLGWCASLKRLTERAALRFIRSRKQARAVLAAA